MPVVLPSFGDAVRRVLAEHALTLRGAQYRTGLNHVTVLNMTNGVVPSMETVVRFARGFGLDVNEWLVLAGYDPIEVPLPAALEAVEEAAERQELAYEPDLEGLTIAGYHGVAGIDEHDRRVAEQVLRAFLAERRRKQGRG